MRSHYTCAWFIAHAVSMVTESDCAYFQKENDNLVPIISGVAMAIVLIILMTVLVIAVLRNYSTARKKK